MAREWQVGDVIGDRYQVRDVKAGGMGIVFLCFDREARDAIALKTLLPRYLADAGAHDRFLREARVWVDLGRHPNIVFAEFVQTIEERPVILMECITGPPGYGAARV